MILGKQYTNQNGRKANSPLLTYNPKLDTLRAIAVCLVIVHHWIPHNKILNFFPNGMMGVTLFFVLSGYLISTILIQSKLNFENFNSFKVKNRTSLVKIFFIRRILRIFPIYYLTLFVLYICNIDFIHQYWPYLFSYTQNFLYHNLNEWPGPFSHLWTLAVEEQFYIIWPWIIIFSPLKYLYRIMITTIIISIISKIGFYFLFPHHQFNGLLLLPTFFSFGFGGLLSLIKMDDISIFKSLWTKILLVIVILLFIYSVISYRLQFMQIELFTIISFALIYFLSKDNCRGVTYLFSVKPVVFIGKISYGLYLYHNFLVMFYNQLSTKYDNWFLFSNTFKVFPTISNPIQRIVWLSILLLLISVISWQVIEKPISRFKKQFSY